ncbi:MAG: hypothetical protein H6810_09175 [Phycisphaeraceae bacterium]|nr:MAG: hypothetical protein H6810_09175 [Phycisphaeraceae bacterium]
MTRDDFYTSIEEGARTSGVFADVCVTDDQLACAARGSAEPAFYRVSDEEGRVWVSLVTPNRWLSESIEAELMHTGDKLEELLEEELVDLGYEGPAPTFEHFRSEDMLFTFRSPVPREGDGFDGALAEKVKLMLFGYEACFRQLGDMSEEDN